MENDSNTSPSVLNFLPASIILMVIGWGGLYLITTNTDPAGGPRWVFYFTMVLALTGTALPLIAFLNRRFPTSPPATVFVVLRQSLWVGIYIPVLAWLQTGRVLTFVIAFLLAIGLILIEWLLRLRERSQKRQKET